MSTPTFVYSEVCHSCIGPSRVHCQCQHTPTSSCNSYLLFSSKLYYSLSFFSGQNIVAALLMNTTALVWFVFVRKNKFLVVYFVTFLPEYTIHILTLTTKDALELMRTIKKVQNVRPISKRTIYYFWYNKDTAKKRKWL